MFFLRLSDRFLVFLVLFVFLFWTPLMSIGYYYEVRYLEGLLNKFVLTLFMVVLLLVSSYKLLLLESRGESLFIYLYGFLLLFFNAVSLFFVGDMNFMVTGLGFMFAPLILSLSRKNVIFFVSCLIISLALFYFLTLLDSVFSMSINPLVEIRYYALDQYDGFRIQHNSLFGQKNAFGSTVCLLFLLLLYLDRRGDFNESNFLFIFLFLLCTILLISSASLTGIVLALLGFMIYMIRRQAFFFVSLFLVFTGFVFFFTIYFPLDFQRKLFSFNVKLDAAVNFLSFLIESPFILLFGFNVFENDRFYTESTLLDMVLNFGVFVPLLLIFYIVINVLRSKCALSSYFFMAFFVLQLVQNSALLLPCIILLLVFISRNMQ